MKMNASRHENAAANNCRRAPQATLLGRCRYHLMWNVIPTLLALAVVSWLALQAGQLISPHRSDLPSKGGEPVSIHLEKVAPSRG